MGAHFLEDSTFVSNIFISATIITMCISFCMLTAIWLHFTSISGMRTKDPQCTDVFRIDIEWIEENLVFNSFVRNSLTNYIYVSLKTWPAGMYAAATTQTIDCTKCNVLIMHNSLTTQQCKQLIDINAYTIQNEYFFSFVRANFR